MTKKTTKKSVKSTQVKPKARKPRATKPRTSHAVSTVQNLDDIEPYPREDNPDCDCGLCTKSNPGLVLVDRAARQSLRGASREQAQEIADYLITTGTRMFAIASGQPEMQHDVMIPTPGMLRLFDAVDRHASTTDQSFDAILEALINKLSPEAWLN